MKKNIFYEEAARIPLLIKWPGMVLAGNKHDACISSVDVMPTLLGLVDAQIPGEVEGMDLSHCVLGQDGPEPEFAFLQNTGACASWEDGHEWRALRDKQYTYAIYRVDKGELLFDNLNDPYQMTNLVSDPAHLETLERFRKMMRDKMESLNDTFPPSTWYRENWIEDRIICRSATMP